MRAWAVRVSIVVSSPTRQLPIFDVVHCIMDMSEIAVPTHTRILKPPATHHDRSNRTTTTSGSEPRCCGQSSRPRLEWTEAWSDTKTHHLCLQPGRPNVEDGRKLRVVRAKSFLLDFDDAREKRVRLVKLAL